MTPLAATLALLAAAAPPPDLWESAYALTDASRAEAAREALEAAGPEGVEVLVHVARAQGDGAAIYAAGRAADCYVSPGAGPIMAALPTPALEAAGLAEKLLEAHPEWAAKWLASPSPVGRAIALVAASRDPGRFAEASKSAERDPDRRVLLVARDLARCRAGAGPRGRAQTAYAAVAARIARRAGGDAVLRCARSRLPRSLVEDFAAGRARLLGWRTSDGELTITVGRDRSAGVALSPSCALSLYDDAAERTRRAVDLILPIAETAPASRLADEAASRAVSDLGSLPEKDRNAAAARLVLAGYAVPVAVEVDPEATFPDEKLLEAAARQGSAEALKEIDDRVFCRGTFGDKLTPLLGYLGTRDAADRAAELARRCPQAVPGGAAALLRLRDPRAVPLLGPALANSAFVEDALARALREGMTPAVEEELRRLALTEANAKKALEELERSGDLRNDGE